MTSSVVLVHGWGGSFEATWQRSGFTELLRDAGREVIGVVTDVTSLASVEALRDATLEAFGGVHIVCNNAGIGSGSEGAIWEHHVNDWRWSLDVNVMGAVHTFQPFAAAMRDAGRGRLVGIASVAGVRGLPGAGAYSASKAGVIGMTLPIARDLMNDGIRVNTIQPGIFNTPLLQGAPDNVKASLAASVPFPKRLGAPDEFAHLALAMVENGYFNGESVRLDGAIRMAPR